MFAKTQGSNVLVWMAPIGYAARLMLGSLNVSAFKEFRAESFRTNALLFGLNSFYFVAFSAVLVATALTFQTVIELRKFQAESFAGAVISIGLLREIGPLTVSAGWCAYVAALVATDAQRLGTGLYEDSRYAGRFFLPRYLAAVSMSIPLSIHGLLIGLVTGGLVASILGAASFSEFLNSSREAIEYKDMFVYGIKLVLVNPTIGVLVGTTAGYFSKPYESFAVAKATTITLLLCFLFDLMVTLLAY